MIASRNSTRHGFYSSSVLLPHEDREEFLRLARRLAAAYCPCGVLEEELVRSIIETRWQLRRANLVDSELFQIYSYYQGEDQAWELPLPRMQLKAMRSPSSRGIRVSICARSNLQKRT